MASKKWKYKLFTQNFKATYILEDKIGKKYTSENKFSIKNFESLVNECLQYVNAEALVWKKGFFTDVIS